MTVFLLVMFAAGASAVYASKPKSQHALTVQSLKILGEYEIVFLIDHSRSMREIISRPVDGDFVNKLDWMKGQLNNFGKQTTRYFPAGFSLVAFNDSSERFDKCKGERLLEILQSMKPSSGTNLVTPLINAAKLSNTTKPLALFVITDAFNVDPQSEYDRVVSAKNNEFAKVRIIFLSMGESGGEALYLMPLSNLIRQKMKPESVTTVPFSMFLKNGLLQTVVKSLQK
jgi:hypothetical protein